MWHKLETPAHTHTGASACPPTNSMQAAGDPRGEKQQVQHSSSAHPLCTQEEYGAIPCNRFIYQTPCHLTIVSAKPT